MKQKDIEKGRVIVELEAEKKSREETEGKLILTSGCVKFNVTKTS